ncbi:MAG: ABC transporter ATP-binding protein/permease [Clostridia bacterium]|nr:ABC transporter ATP-binding protein/permease [Clostridia bacterium]
MLRLHEIKKDYVTSSETVAALKGVSVSFRKNEFVSILGPSGCGKTTLLNIIGGLDHYTSGDLVIGGRSTSSYTDRDWDVYRNHRIGFIFQSYNLIPHQTVLGNVELALTISGVSREERIRRAKVALDRVGLAGQYYKKPNQLSGGQCQRVAIARALVNDPEIADEYSSRIIRLLDGQVIEDTNPFSPEDEAAECAEIDNKDAEELEAALSVAKDEKEKKKIRRQRKEKAKMSFFTAFMLSAKNLLSKKGRTTMVGIAGSIGIIGIALVLAFSAGIKGYIASMQDDMLSGSPITITETTYDLNTLSSMMDSSQKADLIKQPNRVYINSLIEYLAKTTNSMNNMIIENDITKDYVDFIKAMPEEYYSALMLGYDISVNPNLFVDFENLKGENENVSISYLTDMYSSVLGQSKYADLSYLIPLLAPSIQEAPGDEEYIGKQYDVLAGSIATGKDEIMLVLDRDDELADLLLARYGYYTGEEFIEIINKVIAEGENFESEIYRDSFTYDELIGKTFTYYPTDTVFKTTNTPFGSMFSYLPSSDSEGFDKDSGMQLKVVGILSPKENTSYGCMDSGIYYTKAFTDYVIEANADSEFIKTLNSLTAEEIGSKLSMNYGNQSVFGIIYTYGYSYLDSNINVVDAMGYGIISYSSSTADMMSSMMSTGQSTVTHTDQRDKLVRTLGGNGLANSIAIYPLSFDEKNLVTEYLDRWNSDETITVNGVELTKEQRNDVTYTDTLELIINIINTMIDVISYALIAFTSVSLVVSTVMIGIITFVSVVERIKEIGVIRSLGGRKKDVSHLFNAETFIIGLLAGLIGVGATYLISAIVNAILKPLIGYAHIAALPLSDAILLIALSVGLTLISGLIPAKSAANRDPVVALRTE